MQWIDSFASCANVGAVVAAAVVVGLFFVVLTHELWEKTTIANRLKRMRKKPVYLNNVAASASAHYAYLSYGKFYFVASTSSLHLFVSHKTKCVHNFISKT